MKIDKKNNRVEKRKMEKINKKRRMQKMIGISVIIIAVISAIAFIGISINTEDNNEKENTKNSNVITNGDEITIPISDIDTSVNFYSYNSGGVDISYFIVKGSDGKYHAAFDACDVCYGAKKGYSQDGDVMRCINCGLTFPINDLGDKNTGGGCWPSYLPIEIEDNNIIIEKSDLENKRYMFE
jgi:uncharacterized membrane protein